MMTISNDFRILTSDTSTFEEQQEVIERRTDERLCQMLGTEDVPSELEYIALEVSIARFQRLGNEGMKQASQEGLSMTFNDDDFKKYRDEIDDYINKHNPSESHDWLWFNA